MNNKERQKKYVGIDCMPLPRHFSGAANYMLNLTRSLLQCTREFPLAVFCKPRHAPLFKDFLRREDRLVTVPVRNRAHLLWFYEHSLPNLLRRKGIKIFHATHYLCPPATPFYHTLSTFHDMGFIRFPEWYPWLKTRYFRRKIPVLLERSCKVIAVSENTRNDIISSFPETAPRLVTIYPGTDHLTAQDHPPLKREMFILSVNSFEKRKNVAFIIQVFNLLKKRYFLPHRLILVGQPGNDYKNVRQVCRQSPAAEHIEIRLSISDRNLISLYESSDFFISASKFEGFGFSPFEAFRFGLPAFLYRHPVIGELLPSHPYIFDHQNPELWAKIIAGAFLKGFPERLPQHFASQLTWRNSAEKVCRLYESLLTERKNFLVPG